MAGRSGSRAALPRGRYLRDALDKHEKTTGERRRARRPDDQRRYEIAVETVVANLSHAALFNPTDSRLAILTGNKTQGFTRYDNDALGKPLRTLLGGLEALGLVDWRCSLSAAWRRLWPLQSAL